jgi:hypothetical protein
MKINLFSASLTYPSSISKWCSMKPREKGVEEEVICTCVLLSPGSSKLKLLYTIWKPKYNNRGVPPTEKNMIWSQRPRVHPRMELFWIVLDVSRKSKAYTISDCVSKFKCKSAMPNCLFILITITPQHTEKGT